MNDMRIIENCNPVEYPIYPESGIFEDYTSCDFAQFASAIGMSPIMGMGYQVDNTSCWRLGDSNIVIEVTCTGEIGEDGLYGFANFCRDFADIIATALPEMTEYYEIYEYMLNDIAENGVNMFPHYGIVGPYAYVPR